MENKPWLVDVPVLLYMFVRPQCLKVTFEAIKTARPSKLYICCDGPREDHPDDVARIAACKEVVADIDWDCQVTRFYFEENQGMYTIMKKVKDEIFKKEDRLILLEDDVVPEVSFFRYCAELLERYKDDLRVNVISGHNVMGEYDAPDADYFFSKFGSIWGYAIWKRTYEQYWDFAYGQEKYICDEAKRIAKRDSLFCNSMDAYLNGRLYNGHPAGTEYFFMASTYIHNQMYIVPKRNMIRNIGITEGSAHTSNTLKKMPKGARKIFEVPTFEMSFPMKYTNYMLPDETYEKYHKRLLAWEMPVVIWYRRIVSIIKRIIYGEGKSLIKRLPGRLKGKDVET